MQRFLDVEGAGTVIRFKYIVASGKRIVDLRLTVNLLIRYEGYEPIGGVCYVDGMFYQSMILVREE